MNGAGDALRFTIKLEQKKNPMILKKNKCLDLEVV